MECGVVITRDSGSDNVFALCVCLFVCHDVCPDDFTKKDWCLMHNILQLYRISYVSINISTKPLIKSSNIDNQLSCWHIQLPVSSGKKKVSRPNKMRPFWKCYNIKYSFNLKHEKIAANYARKSVSHTDDVTGWPQIRSSIFLCKLLKNISLDELKNTKITSLILL